jgi:hypothetical protein
MEVGQGPNLGRSAKEEKHVSKKPENYWNSNKFPI